MHDKLGYMPVFVFGDGLRRAVTIASSMIHCRNGILLIDELETAVHARALEHNIQLFATTYSIEAIDAVLAAGKNMLNKLVTYRLEAKDNLSIAKRFSGESLYDLRYELGQDVR